MPAPRSAPRASATPDPTSCAGRGARGICRPTELCLCGAQQPPRHEDGPQTDTGRKPGARAGATRPRQAGHAAGRVRAVAVRASDFCGRRCAPRSSRNRARRGWIRGKAAMIPDPPERPHEFTHVPDFAMALGNLCNAPAVHRGQARHMPDAAPARSLRSLRAERSSGAVPARARRHRRRALPRRRPARHAAPPARAVRSDHGVPFGIALQRDRPCRVDMSKRAARLGTPATPFAEGLAARVAAARG